MAADPPASLVQLSEYILNDECPFNHILALIPHETKTDPSFVLCHRTAAEQNAYLACGQFPVLCKWSAPALLAFVSPGYVVDPLLNETEYIEIMRDPDFMRCMLQINSGSKIDKKCKELLPHGMLKVPRSIMAAIAFKLHPIAHQPAWLTDAQAMREKAHTWYNTKFRVSRADNIWTHTGLLLVNLVPKVKEYYESIQRVIERTDYQQSQSENQRHLVKAFQAYLAASKIVQIDRNVNAGAIKNLTVYLMTSLSFDAAQLGFLYRTLNYAKYQALLSTSPPRYEYTEEDEVKLQKLENQSIVEALHGKKGTLSDMAIQNAIYTDPTQLNAAQAAYLAGLKRHIPLFFDTVVNFVEFIFTSYEDLECYTSSVIITPNAWKGVDKDVARALYVLFEILDARTKWANYTLFMASLSLAELIDLADRLKSPVGRTLVPYIPITEERARFVPTLCLHLVEFIRNRPLTPKQIQKLPKLTEESWFDWTKPATPYVHRTIYGLAKNAQGEANPFQRDMLHASWEQIKQDMADARSRPGSTPTRASTLDEGIQPAAGGAKEATEGTSDEKKPASGGDLSACAGPPAAATCIRVEAGSADAPPDEEGEDDVSEQHDSSSDSDAGQHDKGADDDASDIEVPERAETPQDASRPGTGQDDGCPEDEDDEDEAGALPEADETHGPKRHTDSPGLERNVRQRASEQGARPSHGRQAYPSLAFTPAEEEAHGLVRCPPDLKGTILTMVMNEFKITSFLSRFPYKPDGSIDATNMLFPSHPNLKTLTISDQDTLVVVSTYLFHALHRHRVWLGSASSKQSRAWYAIACGALFPLECPQRANLIAKTRSKWTNKHTDMQLKSSPSFLANAIAFHTYNEARDLLKTGIKTIPIPSAPISRFEGVFGYTFHEALAAFTA